MSFATELTKSLASANAVNRSLLSTALTDFRTAIAAELVTYGIKQREKDWFDEQVYLLGRELSASMRTRAGGAFASGLLLSEAGASITDETNNEPILLEG